MNFEDGTGGRSQGMHAVYRSCWRREWQPTPVFFPGESHGQRSLAGYSPWGHKSRTWLSDWTTIEAVKDEKKDSPLEPLGGTQSCWHWSFSPIRQTYFGLQTSRILGFKLLSLCCVKFVVICCSSKGELIQRIRPKECSWQAYQSRHNLKHSSMYSCTVGYAILSSGGLWSQPVRSSPRSWGVQLLESKFKSFQPCHPPCS